MADIYATHPAFLYWATGQYGGRGSFNEEWTLHEKSDDLLSKMTLCVELVFGVDSVVRVASKDVQVTDSIGHAYHFQPLLSQQPEIKLTYSLGSGNSECKSMTVQLPQSLLDPSVLIQRNRMLAGIGEISLMVDGGNYDDRIVILRGEMDGGVSFGPSGTMLETTITDPKDGADVTLPPYVIDEIGFPDCPDESIGQRFPLVTPEFKYVPGVFVSGKATGRLPYCMVAEGHKLTIDTVYVDGVIYGKTHFLYGWEEKKVQDAKGNAYTAIYFNVASGYFDFTEGVYADLSGGDVSLANPIAQIRFLARNYTVLSSNGLNHQLFAKSESKLQNLKSRVCVNAGGSSNTSTISFIEGEFLNSFPMVSMVWERGSYGPVVTDRNQTEKITAYLIAGQSPLLSRASIVQETPKTELYNEFTIRYNYNSMDDVYESVSTRTKENSTICRASQDMVGYRPMGVMDSVWIWEEATAEYVIDWMVGHLASPSYYVEYDGLPEMFFRFARGDNVRLTDDQFGWNEQLATVETLTYSKGHCTVGLRVWSIFADLSGNAVSFDTAPTIVEVAP